MILREFNMEQLIRIVQKVEIKVESIFESGLGIARSNTTLKGYQSSIKKYIESLKKGSRFSGPVNVDPSEPAVKQLFEEVQDIFAISITFMKSFFQLFGIVEGNGLSPFCVTIDSTRHLIQLIEKFFKRPNREMRGSNFKHVQNHNNNDDGIELDKNDKDVPPPNPPTELTAIIQHHMAALKHVEIGLDTADNEQVAIPESQGNNTPSIEQHNDEEEAIDIGCDNANHTEVFIQFKNLVRSLSLGDVAVNSLKLIELLHLGKLDKGAITTASKYKSQNERWFNQKKNMQVSNKECDECDLYLKRDSVVKLECKRGSSVEIAYYRVLAMFTKSYNKWLIADENEFSWNNDSSKRINGHILARLVKRLGSTFQEVKLEKDGNWGPHQVYQVVHFDKIISVENELFDM